MSEQGYIPKDLSFDAEAREKLLSGITAISKAVKSTLGPRGNTVLIESPHHTHGITVTKDGVTVAKSIFLDDPIENLAVRMMKQAADKTASVAGDGTTTAIVLTEAIARAGIEMIGPSHNTTEVIRHIKDMAEDVVASLTKRSKKLTKGRLLDVATISANNDRELGKIIADAYNAVGKDGIVTVEKSQNDETYAEVTNGIKIDRGYTSNLFINNQKKDECILENVRILVADQEISNILQIENVLKPIINGNEKLLIIGSCNNNVVNTLAANVVRNGLQLCNIAPPNFGYKQHELMQDIALAVGAKYFSEKTGDDLSLIGINDLGHADKVIVGRDSTVVIKDSQMTEEIEQRVTQLKDQHDLTDKKHEKDFINSRIASLVGGIGCIYVGGTSDIEQKEKFDRVDDSVCAVRSALQEGILPGGGYALFRSLITVENDSDDNRNVAAAVLGRALTTPVKQILLNAGMTTDEIENLLKGVNEDGTGYNVKTEEWGNLYHMGVIDPLKVTKNALLNAVSVATTILSTNAIVTHARAKQ